MMRQATWAELNRNVLVKAVRSVYEQLGLRLTHAKLGQAVPVAGVVINSALTAKLVDNTFRRAQAVYRLRIISEKYGLDPQVWAMTAGGTSGPIQPVVGVVEVLDNVRALEGPHERG